MARQDFLNGGFIGKLGQVVGQRWHNIRFVRTYTKPHNPQSPAQNAHREMFAHATRLAQEAMNINGHNGEWDTTSNTEFSLRVGTAMRRLKQGQDDAHALPLHPDGTQATPIIVGYRFNPDVGDNNEAWFSFEFIGEGFPQGSGITYDMTITLSQGGVAVATPYNTEVEIDEIAEIAVDAEFTAPVACADAPVTVTIKLDGVTNPSFHYQNSFVHNEYAMGGFTQEALSFAIATPAMRATGTFERTDPSHRFRAELWAQADPYPNACRYRLEETLASFQRGVGTFSTLDFVDVEAASFSAWPEGNPQALRIIRPWFDEWEPEWSSQWIYRFGGSRILTPAIYNFGRTIWETA